MYVTHTMVTCVYFNKYLHKLFYFCLREYIKYTNVKDNMCLFSIYINVIHV